MKKSLLCLQVFKQSIQCYCSIVQIHILCKPSYSEQATVSTGSTSVDLQSDDSGVCCFTDDTPEQLVSTGSEPWFYQ